MDSINLSPVTGATHRKHKSSINIASETAHNVYTQVSQPKQHGVTGSLFIEQLSFNNMSRRLFYMDWSKMKRFLDKCPTIILANFISEP